MFTEEDFFVVLALQTESIQAQYVLSFQMPNPESIFHHIQCKIEDYGNKFSEFS